MLLISLAILLLLHEATFFNSDIQYVNIFFAIVAVHVYTYIYRERNREVINHA